MRTVVYYTDSPGFGGAERYLLQCMQGLDRHVWQPVLCHPAEPGLAPLLEEARLLGAECWTVPHLPLGAAGARRLAPFALRLRALRPSVFHAHLTWPLACKWGLVGAVLARVPAIIASVHLFLDIPYTRLARLQQRLLAVGVSRYLPVSHAVSGNLRRVFDLPAEKLRVLPSAIDLRRYERLPDPRLREAAGVRPGELLALSVARLDPQKGLNYLLEAAAQLPGVRFALAGDGPERAALEAQAAALGIAGRIAFLGYQPDIPAWLASSDLLVLPSLYEGMPISLLEAMAAGKPVVATAIPGVDEVVEPDRTGLLVPPCDAVALANAIRRLANDPSLASRLALAGRERAQEYSIERLHRSLNEIYAELLESREGSYAAG